MLFRMRRPGRASRQGVLPDSPVCMSCGAAWPTSQHPAPRIKSPRNAQLLGMFGIRFELGTNES